jgi:hypothetical protein
MTNETIFSLIDKYRTWIIVTTSILLGALLLVLAYNYDKVHPFASFLLLQLGGLLIFSAGYTALSDYFVRKNFENQVRTAIEFVRLDQSIKDSGLMKITQKFSQDELERSMRESSSVLMLVIRSDGFFSSSHEQLQQRMQLGNLRLTVMLPNPCNFELMALMSAKFSDLRDPRKLAETIQRVVNAWLKQEMYENLATERRSQLQVFLVDKYPLYSAYVFDQREFWYIPYHHRNNHQPLSTYVFGKGFDQTEVYKDLMALQKESKPHDLSQELIVPHFPDKPSIQPRPSIEPAP